MRLLGKVPGDDEVSQVRELVGEANAYREAVVGTISGIELVAFPLDDIRELVDELNRQKEIQSKQRI